jgi:hypothetical protein
LELLKEEETNEETKRKILKILFRPLVAYLSTGTKKPALEVRRIANNLLIFVNEDDLDLVFSEPNELAIKTKLKNYLTDFNNMKNILAYCLEQTLDINEITEEELIKLRQEFEPLKFDDKKKKKLGIQKSEEAKIRKMINSTQKRFNKLKSTKGGPAIWRKKKLLLSRKNFKLLKIKSKP